MASKAILISVVVLRFLTLALLAASVVVMVTNKFTLSSDGSKTTFKDIHAYRYVVAIGIIGFVYTLIQIPFAIYHASKEKRMIRNECLPEFDFYGDKIIDFLLATGVGAGFAFTFEFKRLFKDIINAFALLGVPGLDEAESKDTKVSRHCKSFHWSSVPSIPLHGCTFRTIIYLQNKYWSASNIQVPYKCY